MTIRNKIVSRLSWLRFSLNFSRHFIQLRNFSRESCLTRLLTEKIPLHWRRVCDRFVRALIFGTRRIRDILFIANSFVARRKCRKIQRKLVSIKSLHSFNNYLCNQVKACLWVDPFGWLWPSFQ